MKIKLCAVGGYSEVGKNMTALKINNEAIILDMGFYLQKIVDFEEEGGHRADLTSSDLIKMHAIPNDNLIASWKDKVKAIVLSHAHMDHYGAAPYLSSKYNAPIIATPFTVEVLKAMLKDDDLQIKNKIKALSPNSRLKVSKNIEIELINMTHSTLQTAMIAIHTKAGTIIYANDFKFDNHPVLGKQPNYKRLKEIGQGNVIALVVDSLYADTERKTPSEKVARELLKDVLLGTENKGNAIIATCFASHLARLQSIIDFGKELNRKIVFLGRSLNKYVQAAEKLDLINFSKKVEIVAYRNKIKRKLIEIEKQGRDSYLIVVTGGQGEPRAVLTRMVTGALPFKFLPEDHIIFSNSIIPVEPNVTNRQYLEKRLRDKNTRVFTDLHVSGHCGREDLRDLIKMLNPKHIIPAHGSKEKLKPLAELAFEMGYKRKNVHVLHDGQKISF